MREPINDITRLRHMLEAIDNINEFKQDITFESFCNNKLLKYAIFYNVAVIGEAAYKLSKDFLHNHSNVPWRDIINMRHVIIHGYYTIDDEILWETITYDIPLLKATIMKIIDSLDTKITSGKS